MLSTLVAGQELPTLARRFQVSIADRHRRRWARSGRVSATVRPHAHRPRPPHTERLPLQDGGSTHLFCKRAQLHAYTSRARRVSPGSCARRSKVVAVDRYGRNSRAAGLPNEWIGAGFRRTRDKSAVEGREVLRQQRAARLVTGREAGRHSQRANVLRVRARSRNELGGPMRCALAWWPFLKQPQTANPRRRDVRFGGIQPTQVSLG